MIAFLPFVFSLLANEGQLAAFASQGSTLLETIAPGLLATIAQQITPIPAAGLDVNWLQAALNKVGSTLDVDGEYGDATKAAVSAYQAARGLDVDGWAGVLTTAKLFTEVGANP